MEVRHTLTHFLSSQPFDGMGRLCLGSKIGNRLVSTLLGMVYMFSLQVFSWLRVGQSHLNFDAQI